MASTASVIQPACCQPGARSSVMRQIRPADPVKDSGAWIMTRSDGSRPGGDGGGVF